MFQEEAKIISPRKKKKSLNPLKKNGVMNVVPVRKTWARIA